MTRSKYVLPNFKFYKPKKLKRLSQKVEEQTDKRLVDTSKSRYERALRYLKTGKKLRRSHYKVIAYYLSHLKQEDKELYELFLSKAEKFFNSSDKYYYHLKALLSSYYKEFSDNRLFKLLKLISQYNIKWKEEMDFVKQLLSKSKNANDFLFIVTEEINRCNSITSIEEFQNKSLMKDSNKLLEHIIHLSIMERLDKKLEDINNKFCMKLVQNYLTLDNKKKIFKKVLLDHKDINNFGAISFVLEEWFKLIGNTLGGPYGGNSAKWAGIDPDARDLFKRWKAHKNITVFFGEISGDQRRLDFWQQYSDYFYRVEYFEKYEKALLMESKDHLFIEFAAGGALYMYDKEDLNVQSVLNNKDYSKTRMVTDVLKDQFLCNERLIHHNSDWETKFTNTFLTYGYRKKRKRNKAKISINDVVKNDKGKHGKVMEVQDEYLLVSPGAGQKERWKKKNCKFIREGKETY